jgi:hypothetical protein
VNFKTFGAFIVLLGLIVAAHAGYQLYQIEVNLEETIEGVAYDSAAVFAIPMAKGNAVDAKQGPMKTLGIGGLIVLVGIGMSVSAKKQKTAQEFPGATIVGKFL